MVRRQVDAATALSLTRNTGERFASRAGALAITDERFCRMGILSAAVELGIPAGLSYGVSIADVDPTCGRVCPTATLRNTLPKRRARPRDDRHSHFLARHVSALCTAKSWTLPKKIAAHGGLLTNVALRKNNASRSKARKIRNVRFNENIRLYLPILRIDL